MNKIFIAILATMIVFVGMATVFAQAVTATEALQSVSGNYLGFPQVLSIAVTPGTVTFGDIPYGTDVNILATGEQTVINVAGSSTLSGNVGVTADVTDASGTFFKDLLYFDSFGASNQVDVFSTTIATTAPGTQTHDLRLIGNTATYPNGAKSATITYTITGDPPIL